MNPGNYTISSSLLIPLMSFASGKGVLHEEICNDSGVDSELIHDADARVRVIDADRIVASAARLIDEPSMAAKVGYRLGTRSCNLLQHLMIVSPDLSVATQQQQKFHRLFSDEAGPVLTVDQDRKQASIEYFFTPSTCTEGSQLRTLISMTGHLNWLKFKCGKSFRANSVYLTVPKPEKGADQILLSLGCPVFFNQNQNSIQFDETHLYKESLYHNQHLQTLMEKQCENLLQQLGSEHHQVANALREALRVGQLDYRSNIEQAADLIGVSTRTLNRYLKSEGTNYKNLLSEERIALASQLLREGKRGIEDVAFDVGYSSRRSFDRAFTQAVGISPAAARKQSLST